MKSERTLASLVLDRSRKEDLKRKLTDQNTRTPNKRANHDLPKRDQLPGEDEAVQHEEMGEHEGQDEEEEKKKREKERQKEKERKKEKERQREKERLKEEERRKEKQRMKDKEKQKEKERQREKDKSKESSQQNTKVELPVRLKKYAAFDQLFSGVVFTISGFQNPLRGEIRSKALKMGAEYKGDWGAGCTHLVCAFPNTPKFNQVKGKGKIVKKDWIEESHKRRVRLNWKSYSLTKDPSEESEDEVYEGTPGTPSNSGASAGLGCPAASISGTSGPASTASSSISGQSIQQQETFTSSSSRQINEDENTDDEIERIMEEEKRKEEMQKQQNEKEVEKEKEKLKKKETDKKGERTKNNLVHNNDSFNESEDTDEELKEEAKEVGRRKKEKAGKSLFGDTSSTDDEGNSGNQVAEQRRRRSKSKKAKKRKSSDSDAAYEAETDKENNSPSGSDDAYNAETDVDEDNRKEVLKRIEPEPLINFKDIFKDDVILLKGFEEKEHQLLDRYIVAYGGSVALYNEPRVGIILTKSVNAQQIKDAESVNPSVEILAPEWIFKCVDEQARVSTRGFRAKEA